MKTLLTASVLLLVVTLAPAPAAAAFGVATSAGIGMIFVDKDVERSNVDLEILLFYKLSMLKIDLAMRMDMEDIDQKVQLLPGVRLDLPLVYLRAAIPVNVHGAFDWGFLVGLGMDYQFMKVIAVFAELDTTIYLKDGDPTSHWPLEARVGLELTF
ncbi:MAG: hypothetical protein ABIK09_00035 [Pseudomonadota bacterium]